MTTITLTVAQEELYQVCCKAQVTPEQIQQLLVYHAKREEKLNLSTRETPCRNVNKCTPINEDLEKTIPANLLNIEVHGLDADALLRHTLVRVPLARSSPSLTRSYRCPSTTTRRSRETFVVAQVAGVVQHMPEGRKPPCTCFALDVFLTEDVRSLGPFSSFPNKRNHLIVSPADVSREPIQRDEFQKWVEQVRSGILQGVVVRRDMQQVANRLRDFAMLFRTEAGEKSSAWVEKMNDLHKTEKKENDGAHICLPKTTSVDPYSPLSLSSSSMVKGQEKSGQLAFSPVHGSLTSPFCSVTEVIDEVDLSKVERSDLSLQRQKEHYRKHNSTTAEKLTFWISDAGDTDSSDDSASFSSSFSFSFSDSHHTVPCASNDGAKSAALLLLQGNNINERRCDSGQKQAGALFVPAPSAPDSFVASHRQSMSGGTSIPHALPKEEGNSASGKLVKHIRLQQIFIPKEKRIQALKEIKSSEFLEEQLKVLCHATGRTDLVKNNYAWDANGGGNVSSSYPTDPRGTLFRMPTTPLPSNPNNPVKCFYLPKSLEHIKKIEQLDKLRKNLEIYLDALQEIRNNFNVCAICSDNPPSVIFRPCNHYAVCAACAMSAPQMDKCPICRQKIGNFLLP